MDRWACVDVPALPLQLLLRERPDWAAHPTVVVARERPQAPILWANERARRVRVFPGMRYAAALALARDLRAGTTAPERIAEAVAGVAERLRGFTPEVESSAEEPGVFWLDASGLGRLAPSFEEWASKIRAALRAEGLRARVAVGFSRFGVYVAARTREGVTVFSDAAEERSASLRVPLHRTGLDPDALSALGKLGLRVVEDFLRLPRADLLERLGPQAHRLHRLAAGDVWEPLEAVAAREPLRKVLLLDEPETDAARLLFLAKRLLHPLLETLAGRNEALAELHARLTLEKRRVREERLRPAAPTLDLPRILDLLRLRLEAEGLAAPAIELALTAVGVPATEEQLRMFAERPKRDLEAGSRALARLRAEFGDGAVVRAALREGHLPEASFAWAPIDKLSPPNPKDAPGLVRVRRFFPKAIPLPPRSRREPDGWMVRGLEHGRVVTSAGPYLVSGGWWAREVRRDYQFVQTEKGDVLWIYYDRRRRRWFLQGKVE